MTKSLKEIIEAQHVAPTDTEFQASRNFTNAASWALWGNSVHDLDVFKDENEPWGNLRKDVVLLGGNFGSLDAGFPALETFENFHYLNPKTGKPSSGDSKLRNQLTGGPVAGAFMSDVIKYSPTPYSGDLLKRLKLDPKHPDAIALDKCFFEPLYQEFTELKMPDSAVFVLFGEGTLKVWEHVFKAYKKDLSFLDGITLAVTHLHFTAPGNDKKELSGQFSVHIDQMLEKHWPQEGADPRAAREVFDAFKKQETARGKIAFEKWKNEDPIRYQQWLKDCEETRRKKQEKKAAKAAEAAAAAQ